MPLRCTRQGKLEIRTIERHSLQEGLGLDFIKVNRRHLVSKVAPGSLADRAGVQLEDHIATVNGADADNMAHQDVLTLLRTSLSINLGVVRSMTTTVALIRTTPKQSLGFGLFEHVGGSKAHPPGHLVSRVLSDGLSAGKIFPHDRIVNVNGIKIESFDHKSVLELISRTGRRATLRITRVPPLPEKPQAEVVMSYAATVTPTTELSSVASTVTISRPHPDVEFGMRLAASRGSQHSGYVVTDIAPHGPAGQAGLRVGDHVTAINRINLEKMNERELGTMLAANVKRANKITFGVQSDGCMLDTALAVKAQAVPPRAVEPASINDAERTTTLFRGPTGTFGVVFCGVSGSESRSAVESTTPTFTGGVFVSRIIPGTSAAQNSDVRPGSRVLAINSIPVKMSNIGTVSMVLNTVKDQMALELGPVSRLWSPYIESGHDLLGALEWLKFTLKKKAREKTFGIIFSGPISDEDVKGGIRGVFICGAQPTTAAQRSLASLPMRLQVGTVNGVNVENFTQVELGAVLAGCTGNKLTLTVRENTRLFELYTVSETRTVVINRRDGGSFGLLLAGARDEAEAADRGSGVVINDVKPAGAAATTGELLVGWQLISCNGVNVVNETISAIAGVMHTVSNTLTLQLKPNSELVKAFNVRMPEYPWIGNQVVIELERSDADGFGVNFMGATDKKEAEAHGYGVMAVGTKPNSAAAKHGGIPIGWQVGRLCGVDVTGSTFATIMAIMSNLTGSCLTMVLVPNPTLFAAYQALRPGLAATGGNYELGEPVTVTIPKGPQGFGITFGGATDSAEAESFGMPGVYVNEFTPGGAAARHGGLQSGWQITEMNGVNLETATLADLTASMASGSATSMMVTHRLNPILLEQYGALHLLPSGDADADPDVEDAMGPPVKVVLERGPNGFGIKFGGATDPDEADRFGMPGVYISGLTPGGVAEAQGLLQPGWQITNLNGNDVASGTLVDLKACLEAAHAQGNGGSVTIWHRLNPRLLEAYHADSLLPPDSDKPPATLPDGQGFAGHIDKAGTVHATAAANLAAMAGAFAPSDSHGRTVTLQRGPDGFGLVFDGAKNEMEAQDHGYGLFVKSTKVGSVAASNPDVVPGWQVMALNGIDVSDATFVELKSAMLSVVDDITLELEANPNLAATYRALRAGDKASPPIVTTSLTKDANGFGLMFGGAATEDEGDELGFGVFITGTQPGSVAESDPSIHPDMQVLTLNGTDLRYGIIPDLKAVVQTAGNTLHLELQENRALAQIYAAASSTASEATSIPVVGAGGALDDLVEISGLVEISVTSDGSGFGLTFGGAETVEDAASKGKPVGVFLSGIQDSASGAVAAKPYVGWQIVSVGATDLEHDSMAELHDALQDSLQNSNVLDLQLKRNSSLQAAYTSEAMQPPLSLKGDAIDLDKDDSIDATGNDFTVVLVKDERGYGLTFGGAKTVQEGEDKGYGIFITGTKQNSVAAAHPKIVPGLQVISLNRNDMVDATFWDLKEALRASPDKLTIELGPNPELLQAYQGAGAPGLAKDFSIGGVERSAFAPKQAFRKLSNAGKTTESLTVTLPHDPKGYGIVFGGAKDAKEAAATGGGVFISGVASGTVAGNNSTMAAAIGWQVTRLQGVNLTDPSVSQDEIRTILEQEHPSITLQMEDNQVLRDAYFFGSKSVGATVKVKITRDARGFGIQFGGAQNQLGAWRRAPGVFISKVHPGSVASRSKAMLIAVGWQIVSFNGVALTDGSLEDLKVLLRGCDDVMDLELKDNMDLRASYGR